MLHLHVLDVALGVVEPHYAVRAVGPFAAIQASAGEQAGQFRNRDAVELVFVNMIQALFQIGDFTLQTRYQPFRNLTREHSRFARWSEKSRIDALGLLFDHIEHGVHFPRVREHLSVRLHPFS